LNQNAETQDWTLEIKPKNAWFELGLSEVWRYRDLLWLFVKRDIVTVYQQTILGVFWYFIPPILTTFTYLLIFGKVAKIPTDQAPPILFYLSGIVIWGYFSECFNRTAGTFNANAGIFGKVYFPRLVVPISVIISSLFKFAVQFGLFLAIFIIYWARNPSAFYLDTTLLLLPYLIFLMAAIAMGMGIIFSSLTTKYRDFTFLIAFGMQLLMYATPVIYPTSFLPSEYRRIVLLNPLSAVVEGFRFVFLHTGSLSVNGLLYATCFAFASLLFGAMLFNRVEKSFMDTI
jgi:lipopolysaccharide transport system permease protein